MYGSDMGTAWSVLHVHTCSLPVFWKTTVATKLNMRTPVMMPQVRLTATSSRLSSLLENTTANKDRCFDNGAGTACCVCLSTLAMLCNSQASQKDESCCQRALLQGRCYLPSLMHGEHNQDLCFSDRMDHSQQYHAATDGWLEGTNAMQGSMPAVKVSSISLPTP